MTIRDTASGNEQSNRVVMENPNTGRNDGTIARSMYEPVREAILAAISDAGVLKLSELSDEVRRRTSNELWKNASVGWYTTTVKLDLQAKGLIIKEGSPQTLRLKPKDVDDE